MKQISRLKIWHWLYFMIMPIIFFPILWFVSTVFDFLIGDSSVYLRIMFDSKSKLLNEYLHDWRSALPLSMTVCWIILLPLYFLFSHLNILNKKHYYLSGIVVWAFVGILLYGSNVSGLLAIMLTGIALITGMMRLKRLFEGHTSKSVCD